MSARARSAARCDALAKESCLHARLWAGLLGLFMLLVAFGLTLSG